MLPDPPIFSSRAYNLKKSQAMPLEWYGCHKRKFEYYCLEGSFSHKLLQIFLTQNSLKATRSCQNFLKSCSLWQPFLQSDNHFLPSAAGEVQ